MHADALAALDLDRLIKVDRVRLKSRDVRVVVERVKACGGVPRGARCEFGALDERDVRPAAFRQVIEDAGANDTAANDDDAVVTLQDPLLLFDRVRQHRLALCHVSQQRLIERWIEARILVFRQHPLPDLVGALLGGEAAFQRPLLIG